MEEAKEHMRSVISVSIHLNQIADVFLKLGSKHNLTDTVQRDIFAELHRLNITVAQFDTVRSLAQKRAKLVKPDEYPICREGCSLYLRLYGNMTESEMHNARCPVCHLLYL